MSSCRSSTTPWSSTCAALSFETFGIVSSPRLVLTIELDPTGQRAGRASGVCPIFCASRSGVGGELLLRYHPVLHGEQRRSGAARGTDLRVDVLDVAARGLWRDEEPL